MLQATSSTGCYYGILGEDAPCQFTLVSAVLSINMRWGAKTSRHLFPSTSQEKQPVIYPAIYICMHYALKCISTPAAAFSNTSNLEGSGVTLRQKPEMRLTPSGPDRGGPSQPQTLDPQGARGAPPPRLWRARLNWYLVLCRI